MKFSEKIIRLRRIRGITQDELASAVGVSRQAVYKWECGQSYPEVAKLLEIKALFGISIDDLLDESYEIALPDKKKRKRIKKARVAIIEREVEAQLTSEAEAIEPAFEEITVVEVDATPALEESEELVRENAAVAEAETASLEATEENESCEEASVVEDEAETAETAEEVAMEEAIPDVTAEEQTEEVSPEADIQEAQAPVSEDISVAEEAPADEEAPISEQTPTPEKKRGFFSRLFGRK